MTFGFSGDFDMVSADLFGDHKGGGAALYGQDELQLSDDVTVTLGVRFDSRPSASRNRAGQANPKAAVAYTPAAGTTLRAVDRQRVQDAVGRRGVHCGTGQRPVHAAPTPT